METLGTSYPHQGGEPQPGTSGGGCSRSDRPAPVVVLRWSGPDGWRVQAPALTARSGAARTLSDGGFSLIELMIALVVLAVLLAIAVPTFLGSTGTADNRSAQSNLGTALTDAKAQFQNGGQTYFVNGTQDSTAFAGLLTAAQLSLTFHAGSLGTATTQGSSGSLSTLSVAVSADGNGVVMAAFSIPGNCYYVVDNTMALSTRPRSPHPPARSDCPRPPGRTTSRSRGTARCPTAMPTRRRPVGRP
jgi:type IV pilus assembly protein PilA